MPRGPLLRPACTYACVTWRDEEDFDFSFLPQNVSGLVCYFLRSRIARQHPVAPVSAFSNAALFMEKAHMIHTRRYREVDTCIFLSLVSVDGTLKDAEQLRLRAWAMWC